MSVEREFEDRVRRQVEGTALLVERTERGFDVRANVVDAEWTAFLWRKGLKKTFVHHVALLEDQRSYTITDDAYRVEWKGGVDTDGGVPTPELHRMAERQLGTSKQFEMRKVWAPTASGDLEKVVDYSFSSEEGRRAVRAAAEQLGLEERRDVFTRIGIAVGVLGGLLAVVAAVVVLVLVL